MYRRGLFCFAAICSRYYVLHPATAPSGFNSVEILVAVICIGSVLLVDEYFLLIK